ncbi:MAG: hypothetical protein J6C87_01365 [Bacteroides sp.]|nr:hypothetical protein [Bacteroides sp.]
MLRLIVNRLIINIKCFFLLDSPLVFAPFLPSKPSKNAQKRSKTLGITLKTLTVLLKSPTVSAKTLGVTELGEGCFD